MPSGLSAFFARTIERTSSSHPNRIRMWAPTPTRDQTPRNTSISIHALSTQFDAPDHSNTTYLVSNIELQLNGQEIHPLDYDEHGPLTNPLAGDNSTSPESSRVIAARLKAKRIARLEREQSPHVNASIAMHVARQKGDYARTSRSFGPHSHSIPDQLDRSMAPTEVYHWLWGGAKDRLADSCEHEKRMSELDKGEAELIGMMVNGMADILNRVESKTYTAAKNGPASSEPAVITTPAKSKWRPPLDPVMVSTARSPLARKHHLQQWEGHWQAEGHTIFFPFDFSPAASIIVDIGNFPEQEVSISDPTMEGRAMADLISLQRRAIVVASQSVHNPQEVLFGALTSPSTDEVDLEGLDRLFEEHPPPLPPPSSVKSIVAVNLQDEDDDEEWLRRKPRHQEEDFTWSDDSDSSDEENEGEGDQN